MAAEDYAVVVGIAHYPDISDLKGPENDARDFHAWLINANGGAVPMDQATLILSSDYPGVPKREDARPIVQDINNKFEHMIEKGMPGGRTGRRLYIFLAGHGFSPTQDESALLMANAGSVYRYHIPGRCYAQWFIAAALFDEVVLLMDCCRDDYPFVPIACPPWDPIHAARAYKVRKFFGFATHWTRKSRERPIPPGGVVRGLFSVSLLEGLQGRASDQQGYTTSAKLKGFVQSRLREFFQSEEYQSPDFEGDDDIIFTQGLPCPHTHVRITFGQLAGDILVELIDPTLQLLGQHLPKDGTWEIDLAPGIYKLSVPGAGRQEYFEVIGKEVQDVSL